MENVIKQREMAIEMVNLLANDPDQHARCLTHFSDQEGFVADSKGRYDLSREQQNIVTRRMIEAAMKVAGAALKTGAATPKSLSEVYIPASVCEAFIQADNRIHSEQSSYHGIQ